MSQVYQSAYDYKIKDFSILNHKHFRAVNIASHVSELEIFENIERPYLTGTFNMKDDQRIYDGVGFNGTEIFQITLESPQTDGNYITKFFSIVEIVDATKASEHIEGLEIKIIENIYFNNSLNKINKAYQGTAEQIIKNILGDNLEIDMEEEDMPSIKSAQEPFVCCIPNWTALEACEYIRAKMSTDLGLPYFLYSTLNDNNLQLKSLEEILRNPSINPDNPYRFSRAFNQSKASVSQDDNVINVSAFSSKHKQNTLMQMHAGATSVQHSIIDITQGKTISYTFDVDELFEQVMNNNLIPSDQVPVHHSNYEFKNKKANEYNAMHIHSVVMNNTYNGINNYLEQNTPAQFRLGACNNALRHMLFKTSMSIRVPGRLYLTGHNASLGRQIDFIYPANNTLISGAANVTADDIEDKIRSGTYVIYTARHHFNNQQHNVDMGCVKLGNRK